jgi:D-threo-aldose 1-dehydrogenase
MEIRRIGRTDVSVTTTGFGGAPIGNYAVPLGDEAARSVLDAAWDGGIRYFDTAPLYGTGLSERRIGEFIRAHEREALTISTKAGRLIVPNPAPTGTPVTEYGFHVADDPTLAWDFSRGGIRRSVEGSLGRLGIERLDLVLIHDPDDHAGPAMTEAYPELEAMRSEGLIRAIGVGMNQWAMPLRFVEETGIDVVMLAGRYTLADQTGRPLLDACLARGVSVIAAAPFNSGLLSRNDVPDDTTFNYVAAPRDLIERVRAIARICLAHGVGLAQAALRFPLRHQAVVAVLPGIRTLADATGAIAAAEAPIPDGLWADLAQAALIEAA